MQRMLVAGLLSSALVLGGCVFAPGNHDEHGAMDHTRSQPTIGQQLIDLNRARDNGIISNAEFEQTKAKILNSVH